MYGVGNISATLNDVLRPCNGLGKSEPYVVPYKTELKLMSRRFNRWSRNQVLWGKFVDALKKLIAPEDLISKSFKTVVVYPVNDDVKDFENIAQALDYAFDKGWRNKRDWFIINDKDKVILTDNDIPKTLQGILQGLYGVPSDSLGKPTIKLEFEDNAALADFLKDNQPHYQYAQYTDVTASETSPNSATDAKANTRNSGKLMPAADSRTFPEPPTASAFPPTKTPPPLPPAPTAKALPEHKDNWTLNDIVEHSRNVIGHQYVLFENADDLKYNFSYRWYLDFNIVSKKEICILLRYNTYYDNEIKQDIDININDLRNKEFWKNNAQSFDLVKKLINVSPLLWQIIQIYKPLNDIEGYNYRFDYKDFNLQYWFDDDAEFYHQGFICRISIERFVKLLEKQIIKAFNEINLNNKDDIFGTCYYIVLTNDIISYITGKIPSGLSFNNITPDYAEIKGESFKDGNFVAVKLPTATNEPPVVKFTPKKTTRKEPEIEIDNIVNYNSNVWSHWFSIPKSMNNINDWYKWVERRYNYPQWVISFVSVEDKKNGKGKYYQFMFLDRDKDLITRSVLRPKNLIYRDNFIIVSNLSEVERIQDALRKDGNRGLIILAPHIYEDGLGKPTIKLEFEGNADLMHLFDTDGISGMTVNDKPAAVFNCPESQLDCRGYKPTYKRLANYSHLIDAADGAKTLKGYGFDKSTLDELLNACKQYKQVERLAAHLQDPDKMQSAFNIWHWLHTNIKYDYDTPGEEEIRTPARVWADRKSGVDCDCLAVFTACLLLNMGYQPKFEIVAFNNSPKFSHIYVNLDGAAIDRVLPVFLARPQNITTTKIMDIPVYELSGVGRCASLSGVYSSTLQKIQSGAASGDDNNNFRKMQVIVTLKGIDDAAAKLATLLMPYVSTVSDDGKYYFDSSNVATLAKKFDAELQTLKMQGADETMIQNWLSQVATQLNNVTATQDGEDTIVVIINPKGDLTNVSGKMVETDLQTLTPLTKTAVQQSNAAASETLPAIMQTSSAPATLTPNEDPASEEQNAPWWWLLGGMLAGFGIAAIAKNKKKTR